MTSRFRNTVRTTGTPGLAPNTDEFTVASTVMRSPSWTYPPTPTCSDVGTVTATKPVGMGRYVTSLLLSRSGDWAIRLAVTGESAGMSTRAPFPATALTSKNAWGGTGVTTFIVRSDDWIFVRAPIAFLATTILVPAGVFAQDTGQLAAPGGGGEDRTGRAGAAT